MLPMVLSSLPGQETYGFLTRHDIVSSDSEHSIPSAISRSSTITLYAMEEKSPSRFFRTVKSGDRRAKVLFESAFDMHMH